MHVRLFTSRKYFHTQLKEDGTVCVPWEGGPVPGKGQLHPYMPGLGPEPTFNILVILHSSPSGASKTQKLLKNNRDNT